MECVVVVSSITHAMTGQRLLAANGIKSIIDRDIEAYGQYGCGYVLRIKNDVDRAINILQSSRVKIKDIIK